MHLTLVSLCATSALQTCSHLLYALQLQHITGGHSWHRKTVTSADNGHSRSITLL